MRMEDEPHLQTRVSTCPKGDYGQTSGDAEFKKIHIVKHDGLFKSFMVIYLGSLYGESPVKPLWQFTWEAFVVSHL